MKKISFFLAICLLFSLFLSCEKEPEKEALTDPFTPLFRFAVEEKKSGGTRLFYLKESDGFFYLHPQKGGGFAGGFVSPNRSLSSEKILSAEGEIDSVLVWEKEPDKAYVLADSGLYFTLLKENGSQRIESEEEISLQNAFAFNSLSFLVQKENLLLLCPVDLSESYVLANTALLPDFAAVLATSKNEKTVFYAREKDGQYIGTASFEYGKNEAQNKEDFEFDSFLRVGKNAVLFTSLPEDGGAVFRYRNLETGENRVLIADTVFDGVICDENGLIFCGVKADSSGGEVFIFDLKSGEELGRYPIQFGIPAKSLAVSADAKTLLLSVGKGSDEILGTLDLTSFQKEKQK